MGPIINAGNVQTTRRQAVGLMLAAALAAAGARTGAAQAGELPVVEFGRYPLQAGGEPEPIVWYVLTQEEGRSLLLAKDVLDCAAYDAKYLGTTWASCDLRFWLNGTFAHAAFSDEERARIAYVDLVNDSNPVWGVRGGKATRDHVFCLSLDEVDRYLGESEEYLKAAPTAYAKSRNVNCAYGDEGVIWWLRSPGNEAARAAYVFANGSVDVFGDGVDYKYYGARPAIWLEDAPVAAAPAEVVELACEGGGLAVEACATGLGGADLRLDYAARALYRGAVVEGADLALWAQDELGYYTQKLACGLDFAGGVLNAGEELLGCADLGFEQGAFGLECQRVSAAVRPGLEGLPLVEFGSYPQGGEGEVEPVAWRVLAQEGDLQLLLADRVLDCVPFNAERTAVAWRTSTLREWLNGEFAGMAFSVEELAQIEARELANQAGDRGVGADDATADRVFCLSLDELAAYLDAGSSITVAQEYAHLMAYPTEYARQRGAYANSKTASSSWWLRTSGDRDTFACCVSSVGLVRSDGDAVDKDTQAVRPAVWRRLG